MSGQSHLLTGALMKEAAADKACDRLPDVRKGAGISFAAFSKQEVPTKCNQCASWINMTMCAVGGCCCDGMLAARLKHTVLNLSTHFVSGLSERP